MAKSISAEELQLRKRARRRLIGAIALVTIVAVFLPMALDHEPRPLNQDISIQIPSPNSGAFTSKIVPVVPDAKSVAKPASGTPVQSEAPAKDDAPTVAAAAATKPAADLRTAACLRCRGGAADTASNGAAQGASQAGGEASRQERASAKSCGKSERRGPSPA